MILRLSAALTLLAALACNGTSFKDTSKNKSSDANSDANNNSSDAGNDGTANGEQGANGSANGDSGAGAPDSDVNQTVDFEQIKEGAIAGGLEAGHFDVDTSHRAYNLAAGATDAHVHEYDDKYNVTGIDTFAFLEKDLVEIQDQITDTSKRFVLIVSNAELSPKAAMQINDSKVWSVNFQKQLRAVPAGSLPQVYTLGEPVLSGDKKLSSLKIAFHKDAIITGGLHPTETGLVRKNVAGDKGEYRTGALTVQAIDADQFEIDSKLGVGSLAKPAAVLWEVTLFWHNKGNE